MKPCPKHLDFLQYRQHQAYLVQVRGTCTHDPGDALPVQLDMSNADMSRANMSYARMSHVYTSYACVSHVYTSHAILPEEK